MLGCDGSGTTSDVIAGINWVKAHHAAKSVANLSLGGSKSTALNNAVTALSKSGVFVAVAAGNDSADACYELTGERRERRGRRGERVERHPRLVQRLRLSAWTSTRPA